VSATATGPAGGGGEPAANGGAYTVLGTVQIGTHRLQFYVDFGPDSAVLGFAAEGGPGGRRYFPLYGSTYRGLPSVTLDVFASKSGEEVWVRSSWPGYETLAHHRLGTDRCTTRYGEVASFGEPTPASFGGGTGSFPAMDAAAVSHVATLGYDSNRPPR
jgi:hypothetical protein